MNFELLLSRQKLGTFLENKVLHNEKSAPKMILFNEKNFQLMTRTVPSGVYQKNIGAVFTHFYIMLKGLKVAILK